MQFFACCTVLGPSQTQQQAAGTYAGPQQERQRYKPAGVITFAKRSLLAENSDCCPISFKSGTPQADVWS